MAMACRLCSSSAIGENSLSGSRFTDLDPDLCSEHNINLMNANSTADDNLAPSAEDAQIVDCRLQRYNAAYPEKDFGNPFAVGL